MKRASLLLVFVPFTLSSACAVEQMFPQPVGEGVARLGVRHAGAVVSIIEADERCGFSSDAVQSGFKVHGAPGAEGHVTWTVEDCEIDVASLGAIAAGCDGEGMRGMGLITVSATRTVGGLITGDDDTPVIPGGPDAVRIEVTVDADGFYLEQDGNPNKMNIQRGRLSYVASPRLAVGAGTPGVCSVATPNLQLIDVTWQDGEVVVESPERTFEAKVPTSRYDAQVGVKDDVQNWIGGEIQVWDKAVTLEDATLDETYNPAEHYAGWADEACNAAKPESARVASPPTFECEGPEGLIAGGAARLSVRQLGAVASLINADTECGFSSATAQAGVQLGGAPGGPGTAVWSANACTLHFPEDTVVSEDCNGVQTLVSGSVTVTGTKTLTGWLGGDAAKPVIPLDSQPARIELTEVIYDDLRVRTSAGLEALTVLEGTASAVIEPRVARGASTNTCSVATSHARVSEISLGESFLELTSASGTFRTRISAAALDATNGSFGEQTNRLQGSITVDGRTHDVASLPGGNDLDPAYDAAAFEAGYACLEDLVAVDAWDCPFDHALATGASRLTVNAFGQVTQAIEADTACGFSNPDVIAAAEITGELGRPGAQAVWTIDGCELSFEAPTSLGEDCAGNADFLEGRVRVSGTKTLRGIASGDPGEPIVPTAWDPASLDLTIEFLGLSVSASNREDELEVRSGTLSGRIAPRTAIDEATGACSLPVPIVKFDDLRWTAGDASIHQGDSSVVVRFDSSALLAVNGDDGQRENHIEGTVGLGGLEFNVPVSDAYRGLNPNYDPASFLAGFACAEGLRLPADTTDCSMNRTLAEGAARLIMQAVGEVAGMANADDNCGFNTTNVLTNPTNVEGDVGEQGLMSFAVEGCTLGTPADEVSVAQKSDCMGKETFRSGSFTFTASRDVTGVRDEVGFLGITIADSIVPNSRDAVSVNLEQVTFDEFSNHNRDAQGELADPAVLTLHSGSLSATVLPVLGENAGESGTFDVATPVSALENVALTDAEITLVAQGKTFKFHVDATQLSAFNGTYNGRSNEIDGTITVDGEQFSLAGQSLNPDFDQTRFDQAYACTEDLAAVISN
jgi:hypothetical protein